MEFDPDWGGPASALFEELSDWTKHQEEGIRHYSGTAVYRKSFPAPLPQDKRYTWASYNPYGAGNPLLESGLLGPVNLEIVR